MKLKAVSFDLNLQVPPPIFNLWTCIGIIISSLPFLFLHPVSPMEVISALGLVSEFVVPFHNGVPF